MKKTVMELMGFGDDHVPLEKVAKRQKNREIPVNVPLRKGARKSMRARNSLKLPGTTMSNPGRRKLFDESKGLGLPLISMRQLEDFIILWIVEYHKTPRRGIGKLPRLKATPEDVWRSGMANMPPRDPVDPEIFMALGGHTIEATIQNDGITHEHLTWVSADLLEITAHPDHRQAERTAAKSREFHSRIAELKREGLWATPSKAQPDFAAMSDRAHKAAQLERKVEDEVQNQRSRDRGMSM